MRHLSDCLCITKKRQADHRYKKKCKKLDAASNWEITGCLTRVRIFLSTLFQNGGKKGWRLPPLHRKTPSAPEGLRLHCTPLWFQLWRQAWCRPSEVSKGSKFASPAEGQKAPLKRPPSAPQEPHATLTLKFCRGTGWTALCQYFPIIWANQWTIFKVHEFA